MPSPATAANAPQTAYVLPPLPYGYADLAPVIDEPTMRLHHDKHHQAYTDGINAALSRHPEWQGKSIEEVLRRLADVPAEIRDAVRNQGGGYANHILFWDSLTPRGAGKPDKDITEGINRSFGSLDAFMQRFEETGVKLFGSGWVFLVANPQDSFALEILPLPNQDSPLSKGRVPLLTCDVWEHAYYLKYNNRRAQWLHAWWEAVNWNHAAQLLHKARTDT